MKFIFKFAYTKALVSTPSKISPRKYHFIFFTEELAFYLEGFMKE